MFFLISYDIEDDKKRNKIAKLLENYGTRVQYSVFECIISQKQIEEIKEEAKKITDSNTDSIRFYFICENCVKKINILGIGELTTDLNFYII